MIARIHRWSALLWEHTRRSDSGFLLGLESFAAAILAEVEDMDSDRDMADVCWSLRRLRLRDLPKGGAGQALIRRVRSVEERARTARRTHANADRSARSSLRALEAFNARHRHKRAALRQRAFSELLRKVTR